MHHSLLSRFRGAFLGAALGELLGANCQAEPANLESWLEVRRWGFELPPPGGYGWGRLATALALDLIDGEAKPLAQAAPAGSAAALLDVQLDAGEREAMGSQTGMAIATLPLLLVCHEAADKLHYYLEQVRTRWHLPPEALTEPLMVGYMLSLALRDRLHPDRVIPQLVETLNLREISPALVTQLATVQRLIAETAGLTMAQQQLSASSPLALALYSFLSTPADPRLALLRAARLQAQPQIVCALTGALAGAYNGVTSIPPGWRNALRTSSDLSALSVLWNMASDDELLLLADQLWALWSGVDDPTPDRGSLAPGHYMAAPETVRG